MTGNGMDPGSVSALSGIRLDAFFSALRDVISAVTSGHTADCLLYARVTAAALSYMGVVGAQARMGSAIWRVGPGDSDVISHAIEAQGPKFSPAVALQALPFHSWVEVEESILDFTTWTLRSKARIMDALDGGSTCVEWCPDYLVASKRSSGTLQEVQCGLDAGAYAYIRHQVIEDILRERAPDLAHLAPVVAGVIHVYRASLQGHVISIVGVDEDGSFQTKAPEAKYVLRT